jgi:hypothetical protein
MVENESHFLGSLWFETRSYFLTQPFAELLQQPFAERRVKKKEQKVFNLRLNRRPKQLQTLK